MPSASKELREHDGTLNHRTKDDLHATNLNRPIQFDVEVTADLFSPSRTRFAFVIE